MAKKKVSAEPKKRGRGRPAKAYEVEHVTVRLPPDMVAKLRENPRGISFEVEERLGRSMFADNVDPQMRILVGQLEEIARVVSQTYGVRWHEDRRAHRVFVEVVKRLLQEHAEPEATPSDLKHPPEIVADLIYRNYVAGVAVANTGGGKELQFKPTVRALLES